jgi:hypothetical protein
MNSQKLQRHKCKYSAAFGVVQLFENAHARRGSEASIEAGSDLNYAGRAHLHMAYQERIAGKPEDGVQ